MTRRSSIKSFIKLSMGGAATSSSERFEVKEKRPFFSHRISKKAALSFLP